MFTKRISLSIVLFTTMLFVLTSCDSSGAMSLIGKTEPTVSIAQNITIPDDGKRLVALTGNELYGIRIVDGKALWRTKTFIGGNVWAAGQNAYVTYSSNGSTGLADLNIQNGKPIWNVPFDTMVSHFQNNSSMVFASDGATVYGLTASTGQAQWKHEFPQNTMQLALSNNTLFVGDKLVAAMDTATGNILWQSEAVNSVQQISAVGNTLVVLTKDTIYGLSINNNGQTLWSYPLVGGAFVTSGTMVFVKYTSNLPLKSNGGTDPNSVPGLEAIQANASGTNNIVWNTEEDVTKQDIVDLITLSPSTAYIEQAGDMVDQVVSLQLQNKHVQWTAAAAAINNGIRTESGDSVISIAYSNEEVYALTTHGYLYAFNPPDGTQLWQANTNDSKHIYTTPNDVFVITSNVISLDPLTGTQLWKVNVNQTPKEVVAN